MKLETSQDRRLSAWWATPMVFVNYILLCFIQSMYYYFFMFLASSVFISPKCLCLMQVPPLFLDVSPNHFVLDSKQFIVYNFLSLSSSVPFLILPLPFLFSCSVCCTRFENISVAGDYISIN